jgi:hypothetical protein
MPIGHTKSALAGAWILTAGLIGVLGNVTSLGAGALMLAVGLVPPLIIILYRRAAAPVMVRTTRRPLV